MNPILFLVGVLFAFSGAAIGGVLAHAAKRELVQGKPFFHGLQRAVLVLFLIIPVLFGLSYGYVLLGLLLAMAIVGLILFQKLDLFAHSLFSILIPYSAVEPRFFATMCFLAFLYGLPSMALAPHKKDMRSTIRYILKTRAPFFITTLAVSIAFSVLSIAP